MLLIGLTGGIGSGKTLVSSIFNAIGIPIYRADERARWLMEENPVLVKEVSLNFGKELYFEGALDRRQLAGIVFDDRKKLVRLNSLVHPYVMEDFTDWVAETTNAHYCIHEAAILFESGVADRFKSVITVSAPEDLRIKRVMVRDNTTRAEVAARVSNQMGEEERNQLADHIIYNDEKRFLIPQVIGLHKTFRNLKD